VGAGDTVVEAANEGTDLVLSSVSFTLGANTEKLTLLGTGTIDGTGNSLNNTLMGNSAANVLSGGAGHDIYNVGAGDTVVEAANEGTDLVLSSVSFTLGANTEKLTLLGTGTTDGTGNELNNTLMGNSAANVLTGGAGHDILSGRLGDDTYQVDRGEGQDTIVENDGTVGNSDLLLYGATINPLDLVLSQQANHLRIAIHGSTDRVTIQNWFSEPATAQVETIQAGNGQTLLSTQVDQLIQAMATFSQQTGLTWDQAIDQQPQNVQTILAANWQ
jgi:Ca2+-binding RTX toxin-like protein